MQSMYRLLPQQWVHHTMLSYFLSLSLYSYFIKAISLRVNDLTWRGSLFSSPYCSSGAEKHVPFIKNCMLIRLFSIGAIFTAQRHCLVGEAKEFVFLLEELSSIDWLNIISYNSAKQFPLHCFRIHRKLFKWLY